MVSSCSVVHDGYLSWTTEYDYLGSKKYVNMKTDGVGELQEDCGDDGRDGKKIEGDNDDELDDEDELSSSI